MLPFRQLLTATLLAAVVLLPACGTEDIDPVPKLELLSVTPTTVVALQDSIVFTLKYTDGDGDLGMTNPDQNNVFLTDLRINETENFRLPPLTPDGKALPVTGTFTITLRNTLLTGSGTGPEQVTWAIQVQDQAGHLSNQIVTEAVTVNGQ